MKTLLLLLLLSLSVTNSLAVPAYPHKISVKVCNGKSVNIYMKGDERLKFAITEDGYTVLNDNNDWWYANVSEDGKVIKSSFKLVAKEDETTELKEFKINCPKNIRPDSHIVEEINRVQELGQSISTSPVIGERRSLVILIQFQDLAFTKTKEEFETLFNSTDYQDEGAAGSVRDYYYFASQGQLDYISDVYGPFTSQYPMKYYGGNSMYGGGDLRPLELCIEAIRSLPDDIDYTLYDNNDDGYVDNVHIIYAGYGEEAGASADAIWAHEYPHRIALKNEVGYSFAGYSCSPELRNNRGNNITHIGVICHELGHALGAMDYYDTNYTTGGEFYGTGKWDIMANGSWNDDGRRPANFNPYVRSHVFNWNNQIVLEPNQQIVMPPIERDNAEASIIYRLETGHEGDYFLLENRQKTDFDSELPGEGLMIYHVHPDINKYNSTNTVNASHPQGFYPVCASYSEPKNRNYGNIDSEECPFPGSKQVRKFSSTSSPAALAWDGSSSNVNLTNISMNASNGTISFMTIATDSVITPNEPDGSIEKEIVYTESFETDFTNRFVVSNVSGKERWRLYQKGNFVLNANLIPDATDGKSILMLFLGKENAVSESEIVGQEIEVIAHDNYIFSFDISSYITSNGYSPQINLYLENEYGEFLVYNSKDISREWETIEIPLVLSSEKFNYKIKGSLSSGGLFIDNIKLYKEKYVNSLKTRHDSCCNNNPVYVYRSNGTFVGCYMDNNYQLDPGLYFIRKGNSVRKRYLPK